MTTTETYTEFRIVRTDETRPDYIAQDWVVAVQPRAEMEAQLQAWRIRDGHFGLRYSLQEREVTVTRTDWTVTP